MLTVTKADIISFSPCQSSSYAIIDELMNGRESVDIHYVLSLSIPDDHILWLCLRPQLLPPENLIAIDLMFASRLGQRIDDMQRYIAAIIRHFRKNGESDQAAYDFMMETLRNNCG